jgi:hypothetical protein
LCGDTTLRVISLATLKKLYAAGECNMVIVPNAYHLFDMREIRQNLREIGIADQDVFIVPYNRLQARMEETGPGLEPLLLADEADFIFETDVHVVDHCNLQCKACAHFSNCVDEPVIYDARLLHNSLKHLSELVPNVHLISLLGGEPLLHPKLDEIIVSTREFFPYARIRVLTNGILLERISPSLLELMRSRRIGIVVSLYPPLYNQIDRISAMLKNWGGEFRIIKTDDFERRLNPFPIFDPQQQFAKCGHDMCLRGSRLGYCVIALFTDYYNKHFAAQGVPPLPEDSGVDIFAHTSGKSLLEALNQPLELCSRCISCNAGTMFFEKWENKPQPEPDDWLVSPPFAIY